MSTRQDIKDALKTDLLTITTDNGYNLTINGVSKKFVDLNEVDKNSTPYISMVGGISSYNYGETTPVVTWQLTLICYFKLTDSVDGAEDLLEAESDKFLDDLMTLFGSDTNVKDQVIELLVSESLPDPFHEGNMGACWVTLNIEYAQL